MLEIESQL